MYLATAAVVVFAVASTVAFGLAALRARHAFVEGVRLAEEAVASLEYGDYDTAAAEFEQAAAALERAHADVSSPWARGAGLVPVVAQHYDAAVDLSAAGASGSAVVAEALGEIDPETLRVERGRIDLAAVSALGDPLGRVEAALEDLHAIVERSDSPWLIGPADYEITDFQESIAAHLPQLENALDAIELAPRLLGADEPRTYLVLFTSPVEARGLGGSVASYAELRVEDGQARPLGDRSGGAGCGDAAFARSDDDSGLPAGRLRMRGTPTPVTTGRTVDGVIALDPYVLAALLGYSGPIQLTDVRRRAGPVATPRSSCSATSTSSVQATASSASMRSTRRPSARWTRCWPERCRIRPRSPVTSARSPPTGDCLMWSADPEVQELLERVGLDGSIPALDGREGWAVTVSNAGGNKIDSFLSPAMWYESSVDPGDRPDIGGHPCRADEHGAGERAAAGRDRQRRRVARRHEPAVRCRPTAPWRSSGRRSTARRSASSRVPRPVGTSTPSSSTSPPARS